MPRAVARKCQATRAGLGIFGAFTLSKIEVSVPNATEFMKHRYTNPWAELAPRKCHCCLLPGEDGVIRDDGVIGRMRDDLFHVTTTGGAARVLNMMEDRPQTEWPNLRVWLTPTTEEWAIIAFKGPQARKLLAPLVASQDMSDAAFPHLSVAEYTVAGFPSHLFRICSGSELGFEVNVPAHLGRALWARLKMAGKPFDNCPCGTETIAAEPAHGTCPCGHSFGGL